MSPALSCLRRLLPVLPLAALLAVGGYYSARLATGGPLGLPAAADRPAPQTAVPVTSAVSLGSHQDRYSNALGSTATLAVAAALEGGGNLFDYAGQLRLAADGGDAQAAWTLSRIYDYCALYAQDPQGYSLDDQVLAGLGLEAVPGLLAARSRVGQRCQGFARGDQLGRLQLLQRRQQAARSGNLAAEAALLAMGEPLSTRADYRSSLVERVIQSQDPEAFLALSPAMGAVAAGDQALAGQVAGSQFTQLAWQVAACRLGLDCGPDSVLMTTYCANGGICSRKPEQGFEAFVFDAAIAQQGGEKMNEMINYLRRPPEAGQ